MNMVDRVIHKFVLWFSDNPFYQFFLKYKKLIVAVLITAILVLSKEMILLNEESLLIIAFLYFVFITIDTVSQLLKNELNARTDYIRSSWDRLNFYDSFMYFYMIHFHFYFASLTYIYYPMYKNVRKSQRKVEHLTLVNSSEKGVQKNLVDQALRTLLKEEKEALKSIYFMAISQLKEELYNFTFDYDEFVDAKIELLDLLE